MRQEKIAVFGHSDFLRYWEHSSDDVVRIPENSISEAPHVFFAHIGRLDEVNSEDSKFSEVIRAYKNALGLNDKFVLVIDYAHEAVSLDARFAKNVLFVHRIVQSCCIDANRVILLHHNSLLLENSKSYIEFCDFHGIKAFKMMYSHTWLLNQSNYIKSYIDSVGGFERYLRDKMKSRKSLLDNVSHKFLCFNYFPRFNRVVLLLTLMDRGIFDQGLVSFAGFRVKEMDYDFYDDAVRNLRVWRGGQRLAQHLPHLASISPLRIDADGSAGKMDLAFMFDAAPYQRTLFSIVTDTGLSSGIQTRRITEKFLKSMLHLHPFFLLGEPFGLNEIRNLGFRTFETTFDEAYDSISDPERRMRALVDAVEELCALDINQLVQHVGHNLPAMVHNLHHLSSQFPLRMREIAEFNVVHAIRNILNGIETVEADSQVKAPAIRARLTEQSLYYPDLFPPLLHHCELEVLKAVTAETSDSYRLRADESYDNHCLTIRAKSGHEKRHHIHFDVENCGFPLMMICLKAPLKDEFRLIYSLELGVIVSADVYHDDVNIDVNVSRLRSSKLHFELQGTLGSAAGEFDVVIYLGQNDFKFIGIKDQHIVISNIHVALGG